MKPFSMFICLLLIITASQYSLAQTVQVNLVHFNKATYLISQGRYMQAAKHWHQLSLLFLRSEQQLGTRDMWQHAGLAEALAAMSASHAERAISYQYWADSTRYLLTGGTNWQQMQKNLHRRYENMNSQISSFIQVNELSINADDQWQTDLNILQVWNDKLAIFSFSAPKFGLNRQQSDVASKFNSQRTTPRHKRYKRTRKLTGLNGQTFYGQQVSPTAPILLESAINPSLPLINKAAPVETIETIESKVELIDEINATSKTEGISIIGDGGVINEVMPLSLSTDMPKTITLGNKKTPLNNTTQIDIEFEPAENTHYSTKDIILQPSQIPHANIAIQDSEKVESRQRRTFIPITENE